MKNIFKFTIFIFILVGIAFFFPQKISAIEISVEAPQETLTMGQIFDFKINIDTKGQSVTKEEMMVTYINSALELVSGGFLAGDFFENVQYSPVEPGKIYVVGSNSAPKSGSGNVAVIKFKIIATAPGSATLCAVSRITPTPTVPPSMPIPTTPPPVVTNPPPVSGTVDKFLSYSFFGATFVVLSALVRRM